METIIELTGKQLALNKLGKKTAYVTFGSAHSRTIGDDIFINYNCVVRLYCTDWMDGRRKAMKIFGERFSFYYFDSEWDHTNNHFYPRGFIDLDIKP